jgi:hypothetical protein
MVRRERPPSRRRSRPEGVVPAVSHESPCRWDVIAKAPPPGAGIHSGQTPLLYGRNRIGKRIPGDTLPGFVEHGYPLSPKSSSPHLYEAMEMVVMPMKGRGPNCFADTGVPGCRRRRRTRPPGGRSRAAGSRPPTTAPHLRYLDPPRSMSDHVRLKSDGRDLRATGVGTPPYKSSPCPRASAEPVGSSPPRGTPGNPHGIAPGPPLTACRQPPPGHPKF